jgi:3-phenylpropionate/trans-cinnamate dioxygenase ferredoxin reductase subunit
MARSHQITINGESFFARRGELLLDAALSNGVELPFDCRAGHCGSCCVRVVSGNVHGGEGSEPGVVHACQCRVVADVEIEKLQTSTLRTVDGVLSSMRPLSREVMEVGIRLDRALPYHAGQYAQLRFAGYPSRPFSITLPLRGNPDGRSIWFHIRKMEGGRVTPLLGRHIRVGHKAQVTGPYGSAHFKPNQDGRLILVGTNTGFAPIWSIAVAALRENPERRIMVIAGGRNIESLYMGPALGRLARFPNVRVVPCCSRAQNMSKIVKLGRPTDFLPHLHPTDVLYVCGAPEMVASVKSIATQSGAVCYADPFVPNHSADEPAAASVLTRVMNWLAAPAPATQERIAIESRQQRQLALPPPARKRREQPAQAYRVIEAEPRVRRQYGPQSA